MQLKLLAPSLVALIVYAISSGAPVRGDVLLTKDRTWANGSNAILTTCRGGVDYPFTPPYAGVFINQFWSLSDVGTTRVLTSADSTFGPFVARLTDGIMEQVV